MSFIELFRTLYDIIRNILFILRSYIAEFFFEGICLFLIVADGFTTSEAFLSFISATCSCCWEWLISWVLSVLFMSVKKEKSFIASRVFISSIELKCGKNPIWNWCCCVCESSCRFAFFLFTLMYWYYQPYCRARDIRAKIIRFTLSKWFSFCFACFFVFTGNRNHYPLYLELQHI